MSRPAPWSSGTRVEAFVAHSLVVLLGTASRSGRPALTPIWFVRDGGRYLMSTGAATAAARNVAANPDVALLFYGERARERGYALRVTGRGAVHRGLPSARQLLRWAAKYYLPPGALCSELSHLRQWRLRQKYYAQAEPVVIEVVPEFAVFVPRSGPAA